MAHIPVLQNEALEYLAPKPNDNFIDCTVDGGGHSRAILERTEPEGKVLGIEADTELYQEVKSGAPKRLILVNDNFVNLKEIVKREKFKQVQGILFDLGMSSWHLEESGRGFSFLKKEPLDMRYSTRNPLTAEKILNYWSVSELERILREYGEERFSGRISQEVIKERNIRPITDTSQLIEIIKRAVPQKFQHQRIHFATRVFQALRIAVNDELNNLKKALPQTIEILGSKGRLVVISFHSLEDRIVKNFLREESKDSSSASLQNNSAKQKGPRLKILTKKPISPNFKEIKINARARSAKLRAAEKI